MHRTVPWARIKELPCKLGAPRVRHVAVAPALGRPGNWVLHNASMANSRRAVVERVFAVERNGTLARPPQPARGAFRRLDDFGTRVARACGWTRPLTAGEFVDLYTGARHARYKRAWESFSAKPYSHTDAYLNSFVKGESVLLTAAKPDPAPRIIQPRSARYNLLVGRYLRPLEHKVYDAITEVFAESGVGAGIQVVFKGLNATQSAAALRRKWDRFTQPRAVGADATRFDQHISTAALTWEHGVYAQCFRGRQRKELERLLERQLINKGFVRCSDGAFTYTVKGSRMSGDMNTALGNCLIMCALVHRFATEHNIKIELANNGDDCQLIHEARDTPIVERFGEWCLKFGFQIKMEDVVDTFEQVEFCQTRPVWTDRGWVMARDPRKALSKDVILKQAATDMHGSEYHAWLRCVALSGLTLSVGVPVMEAFYRCLLRHSRCGKFRAANEFADSGFARMTRGMREEAINITPEARYSFWLAYGILPDAQVVLENHFANQQLDLSWRDGQSLASAFHFTQFI